MIKTKRIFKISISLLIAISLLFSFLIFSLPNDDIQKAYSSHVLMFRNITEPQDDVYIREEFPDINYNSNNWLMILETTGNKDYRTFLKFNFSLLPVGDWDIVNITIGLFCWQVDADCDGAMTGMASCDDNTWTEETLTWNNQPEYGNEISVGGGGSNVNEWKLWSNDSLTNYVNNTYQNGSDGISFIMLEDRLRFPSVLNDDRYWDSKEYVDAPFMVIWFQESYITFTSIPVISAEVNLQYIYNVTGKFWYADLNITTTAPWLIQEFDSYNLTGVPQITHIGIYLVNLTLYYNGTTVYQNFTIGVMQIDFSPVLLLSLLFGFSFLVIGFFRPEFFIFSGIVWMFSSVTSIHEYGNFFMIIGLGLGMFLMIMGGAKIADR